MEHSAGVVAEIADANACVDQIPYPDMHDRGT